MAHEQKLSKMESEMRAVFQAKVAEKESKLKQSEVEVRTHMTGVLHLSKHDLLAICTS